MWGKQTNASSKIYTFRIVGILLLALVVGILKMIYNRLRRLLQGD